MEKLKSLSLLAALGLASVTFAQTQTPPDTSDTGTDPYGGSTQQEPGSRDMTAPTTQDPTGSTAERQDQQSQTDEMSSQRTASADSQRAKDKKHRVSKLIGTDVQSPNGDDLGEVEDVIIDESGKVTHVVISHGGTLGVGEKLVAVPWDTVSTMMRGENIVMERTRLENAPSFQKNNWPNVASATWSSEHDRYWEQGSSSRPMRSASGEPTGTTSGSTSQESEGQDTSSTSPSSPRTGTGETEEDATSPMQR